MAATGNQEIKKMKSHSSERMRQTFFLPFPSHTPPNMFYADIDLKPFSCLPQQQNSHFKTKNKKKHLFFSYL